jgi:hypothetical protein
MINFFQEPRKLSVLFLIISIFLNFYFFSPIVFSESITSSVKVEIVTTTTTTTTLGGGGGGYTPLSETKVIFSGRAYPKSTVTLLKDAQIVAKTVGGADANFEITLTNVTAGSYIFSVYSEDNKGNRSSLLTFPLTLSDGVIIKVTGIFISPTIDVDKSEVKKGEVVKIFGQSIPNSDVIVIINSEEEIYGKTKADKIGAYLYNLDTVELETGEHLAKSRATLEEEISPLSKVITFKVGTKTVLKEVKKEVAKGDTNNDNRVNLVDFSIAAYWYKRSSPPAQVDLNKDGKVDLVDFSIMAYYWTG